jgi:hypothetical protein
MHRLRRRGLLAALVALPLVTMVACSHPGSGVDHHDPYDLVLAYIDAVNRQDEGRVRSLVNPAYDVGDEVTQRLHRYGGKSLYYERMQFNGTGMREATAVDLTLRSGVSTDVYTDKLSMSTKDGRWYLDLGRPR